MLILENKRTNTLYQYKQHRPWQFTAEAVKTTFKKKAHTCLTPVVATLFFFRAPIGARGKTAIDQWYCSSSPPFHRSPKLSYVQKPPAPQWNKYDRTLTPRCSIVVETCTGDVHIHGENIQSRIYKTILRNAFSLAGLQAAAAQVSMTSTMQPTLQQPTADSK